MQGQDTWTKLDQDQGNINAPHANTLSWLLHYQTQSDYRAMYVSQVFIYFAFSLFEIFMKILKSYSKS